MCKNIIGTWSYAHSFQQNYLFVYIANLNFWLHWCHSRYVILILNDKSLLITWWTGKQINIHWVNGWLKWYLFFLKSSEGSLICVPKAHYHNMYLSLALFIAIGYQGIIRKKYSVLIKNMPFLSQRLLKYLRWNSIQLTSEFDMEVVVAPDFKGLVVLLIVFVTGAFQSLMEVYSVLKYDMTRWQKRWVTKWKPILHPAIRGRQNLQRYFPNRGIFIN